MQRSVQFSLEEFYHAYNRGTDKRKIFLDDKDYKRFVRLLFISNSTKKFQLSDYWNKSDEEFFGMDFSETLVDIGAYCLMQNHFHLLLREKTENGISIFMKKLLTSYSMYFNKKYHRTGSLFEGAFKSEHVDEDRYLQYLFAYIHLNPIGIIDSGWKYKEIEEISFAKKFLDMYEFSSLYEFRKIKRPESVILNQKVFPEYFETISKFDDMLNEFIFWAEENRLKDIKKLKGEDLVRSMKFDNRLDKSRTHLA